MEEIRTDTRPLLPATRMDSLPVRGRTGGRAATSAKVLTFGPPLAAAVPCAETPVGSVDDGKDDDTRPLVLAPSVGAWTVGRGCAAGFLFFRLALPLHLPMTVVNPTSSADDSTVNREVSLAARDLACTVLAAAESADGGVRSPWLYSSPPLLQLTDEQDLEIL